MRKSKSEFKIRNSDIGITLIALVITIIVLIILAGVSINLVLGDNGIITKAKEAKTETEQAKLNEEVALNEIVEYMENNGGTSNLPAGPTIIEGPIAGGSYDNPYIPAGFTHTEGEGTWNSGYVIKEKETGNVFVWVPCVLDQSKVKDGDMVQTFKKITTGKYNRNAADGNSYRLSPTDTSVTDVNPTNAIKTSVGTYGGFYIAAYEAGVPLDDNKNEIAATSATTSQKARSVAGATAWTNITRTNAITAASNMITTTTDGVKSGLISGECWDTTLQWMVNSSTNAASNVGYDTNSAGKGWYNDVSGSARHTTGYYAVNNIYDMAGNVSEWATENSKDRYGNSYLVSRGGLYNNSGLDTPAAYRLCLNDCTSSWIAFRIVLYK